ncbi:MAG: hypothetical protein AAF432_13545 [Planctomycetota bacterium]
MELRAVADDITAHTDNAEPSLALTDDGERIVNMGYIRALDDALFRAGIIDLEAGRLVAEQAWSERPDDDAETIVNRLCLRSPALFGRNATTTGVAAPHIEPSDANAHANRAMHVAADKARTTGDRTSVLEFMRLKRRA